MIGSTQRFEIVNYYVTSESVIPAKAGIQSFRVCSSGRTWMPACAGMTKLRFVFDSVGLSGFRYI
jgi:hypothetical protein